MKSTEYISENIYLHQYNISFIWRFVIIATIMHNAEHSKQYNFYILSSTLKEENIYRKRKLQSLKVENNN